MFNKKDRLNNSLKSSIIGVISQIFNLILGFAFRTIFLLILTKEYLGLNGMFTNILGILSLADLGINLAIIYRLFKPIKENDVKYVAQLMYFFGKVYKFIAIFIFVVGMAVMPFLKYMIHDLSKVPKDINLYFIYFLFLLQTISTYLFVYKQTILDADQNYYQTSLFNFILSVCKYAFQILVLVFTKNYTLTLIVAIGTNISFNYIFSLYITKKYKEVFKLKENLPKEKRKEIYIETKNLLYHRIGGVALSSTDNLVLVKFIGLGIAGIYDNYLLILISLTALLRQLFAALTGSIGNHYETKDKQSITNLYHNLTFFNMWISTFCSITLMVLLNPFIKLWIGQEFLLKESTVILICISFYISNMRFMQGSYTTVTGLVGYDRFRPLLEAGTNLILSIILVKLIGINGIFIGTIVSMLLFPVWREPYLISKYKIKNVFKKFATNYILQLVLLLAISFLMYFIKSKVHMDNKYFEFIILVCLCVVVINACLLITNFWKKEFKYFLNVFINLVKKVKEKVFVR